MSEICRLCLKSPPTLFASVDGYDNGTRISSIIKTVIPELNLAISIDPMICMSCYDVLRYSYRFRMECLRSENLIAIYMRSTNACPPFDLLEVTNQWRNVCKSTERSGVIEYQYPCAPNNTNALKGPVKQYHGPSIKRNTPPNQRQEDNSALEETDTSEDVDGPLCTCPSELLDDDGGHTSKCEKTCEHHSSSCVYYKPPKEGPDRLCLEGDPLNNSQPPPSFNLTKSISTDAKRPITCLKPDPMDCDIDMDNLVVELLKKKNLQKLGISSSDLSAGGSFVLQKFVDQRDNSISFTVVPKLFEQTDAANGKESSHIEETIDEVAAGKPIKTEIDTDEASGVDFQKCPAVPATASVLSEEPNNEGVKDQTQDDNSLDSTCIKHPPALQKIRVLNKELFLPKPDAEVQTTTLNDKPSFGNAPENDSEISCFEKETSAPLKKLVAVRKVQGIRPYRTILPRPLTSENAVELNKQDLPKPPNNPEIRRLSLEQFEDLIDIKEEPLSYDEGDWMKEQEAPGMSPDNLANECNNIGSESTRSASETSEMEKIGNERISQLLSDIVDEEYDQPEYVQINKVSIEEIGRLARETGFSQTGDPMSLIPEPDQSKKTKKAKRVSVKGEKRLKLAPVDVSEPRKRIKPRMYLLDNQEDQKDVCVLFTNFTSEGDYINDHDYLISPYSRNRMCNASAQKKIENCICLLCDMVHTANDHINHMKCHGTRCGICCVDFHNVFILNIHVRRHLYYCRECGNNVLYTTYMHHALIHNRTPELSNIEAPLMDPARLEGKKYPRKKAVRNREKRSRRKEAVNSDVIKDLLKPGNVLLISKSPDIPGARRSSRLSKLSGDMKGEPEPDMDEEQCTETIRIELESRHSESELTDSSKNAPENGATSPFSAAKKSPRARQKRKLRDKVKEEPESTEDESEPTKSIMSTPKRKKVEPEESVRDVGATLSPNAKTVDLKKVKVRVRVRKIAQQKPLKLLKSKKLLTKSRPPKKHSPIVKMKSRIKSARKTNDRVKTKPKKSATSSVGNVTRPVTKTYYNKKIKLKSAKSKLLPTSSAKTDESNSNECLETEEICKQSTEMKTKKSRKMNSTSSITAERC